LGKRGLGRLRNSGMVSNEIRPGKSNFYLGDLMRLVAATKRPALQNSSVQEP